jgi:hypothetical protein
MSKSGLFAALAKPASARDECSGKIMRKGEIWSTAIQSE